MLVKTMLAKKTTNNPLQKNSNCTYTQLLYILLPSSKNLVQVKNIFKLTKHIFTMSTERSEQSCVCVCFTSQSTNLYTEVDKTKGKKKYTERKIISSMSFHKPLDNEDMSS